MNEETSNHFIRGKVARNAEVTSTDNLLDDIQDGIPSPPRATVLPDHIVDLMSVQKRLRNERETTYKSSRKDHRVLLNEQLSLRTFFRTFITSEDEIGLQCTSDKQLTASSDFDKEPVFVFADSSCVSNSSSTEIHIDHEIDAPLKTHTDCNIKSNDIPTTSKDLKCDNPPLMNTDSSEYNDELQMMTINLQSENEIDLDDDNSDKESIVLSYLRNRNVLFNTEGLIFSTKKKSSILRSVPKMETILEGEQFTAFPITSYCELLLDTTEKKEVSLSTLASYLSPLIPGTSSNEEPTRSILDIAEYLHRDNQFLIAAETGNAKLIEILIRKGVNIQEFDNIGRNALHLAVCSNSFRTIVLLLEAGVDPNVKDNVGMTPLSLCIMRRPSVLVANLLFDHGAKIMPRTSPMDTGLFLQFVIMCTPTSEEAKILRLLIAKGAQVNDLQAPGGRQALHFAAMSNNCRLIKLLADVGADCFLVNHRKETPRQVAITFKCREAQILLGEIEEGIGVHESCIAFISHLDK